MAQLNVHQLEVFRAVARLGNITRAAVELVISQPAVSEQVKELEIACGMPLLERLPRGVRLTQAGEVVYEYAERLFTAAEQLEQTLAELRSLLRGRLRLGASMTIGQYVLPAVMGAFGEQHPGVRLSLIVGNSSAIVARVVERELGLGFVGGAPTQAGLIVVPYLVDEIVVIVAPGHDLAFRPTLSAEDLRGASWIAREQGSATRSEAEACFASAGIQLTPVMELGSNEAVKQAVAAGLGFGLLSRLDITAEPAAEGLVVRTVADWNCRRLFCVCYRRDRRLTRPEQAFLQFIDCQAAPGAPSTTTQSPVDEAGATRLGGTGWEASMERFKRPADLTGRVDHPGGTT